jgi:hybrid cluster-associated redox disulfide protein
VDAIHANASLNVIVASAEMKMVKKRVNNNITKDMSFADIIEKNPEAVGILMGKGMHCIGCGMAAMETLEQGALMHGMNPDELVKEINKKTGKK